MVFDISDKDREILLNVCYGGFGFSDEFVEYLISVGYFTSKSDYLEKKYGIKFRMCPILIGHVRDFKKKYPESEDHVSGEHAKIKIHTIPAYHTPEMREYDGIEGIIASFPWEAFARGLMLEKRGEVPDGIPKLILDAVTNGTLLIPNA